MRLTLIQSPNAEPLTADEVRERLNIGSEVTDAALESFIASSRLGLDGVDGYLGRALITQTWRGTLDGFPSYYDHHHCGHAIVIPLPPLQSINSITYVDGSGATQTIEDGDYQIVPGPRPYIVPAYGKSWPPARFQRDAVEIEFVAGYGDNGSDVPEPIRCAIALQVSQFRSLSSRDQNVMIDNVVGVGSKTYTTGRDGGADALTAAAMALVSSYRVLV
ncbi:putative phiE125 gp8 family phage protein [Nitrobacteraceae bacterium AZCC 2161]